MTKRDDRNHQTDNGPNTGRVQSMKARKHKHTSQASAPPSVVIQPEPAANTPPPEPTVSEFIHPQQAALQPQRATRWLLKGSAGGLIPVADTTLVAGKKVAPSRRLPTTLSPA